MREARERARGEIGAGGSNYGSGGTPWWGGDSAMTGDGVDMWCNCVRGGGARGSGRLGGREIADRLRHCIATCFQISPPPCPSASDVRPTTKTLSKKPKSKAKQHNSIRIKPNGMGIPKKFVGVKHEPKQQNSVEKNNNGPGVPKKTTESRSLALEIKAFAQNLRSHH